jgi:histidine triad (HIT) family protein
MLSRMHGCVFCRVVEGTVPARILFADDDLIAFHDIAPRAPVHVLIIPRRHIASLAAAATDDCETLGKLLLAAAEVARRTGVVESGYRVVANTGSGAGQSVAHLHLHVLGGRKMAWPPG